MEQRNKDVSAKQGSRTGRSCRMKALIESHDLAMSNGQTACCGRDCRDIVFNLSRDIAKPHDKGIL